MAGIAEGLLLLLLDNAAATPSLDEKRRRRLLAGAVILDLAHSCRVRPALAEEPVAPNRLVALVTPEAGGAAVLGAAAPVDAVSSRAWNLLARKPISAGKAIAKLSRWAQDDLLAQLERSGQIRPVRVYRARSRPEPAWLLTDRGRVTGVRAAMVAALFDGAQPDAPTAAIITLLHAAGGLRALLSLDSAGWQLTAASAAEIASGSWVPEDCDLAEMNVAVTAAAVRPALG